MQQHRSGDPGSSKLAISSRWFRFFGIGHVSLVAMLKEHHLVVQLCTEVKARLREDGYHNAMDEQTCPYCNQPVKAEQAQTVNGQLAHAECSAKAGGEAIYVPGADQVS
jgi:hypothetical protein